MSTSKKNFLLIILFFAVEGMGGSKNDTSLLKYSWRYYYKRGMLQYNAGMYDFSIDSLKKAMSKKPDLYHAANTLGAIYKIKNKQSEALEALELSLKINRHQPNILCDTALLLEFFARPDRAFAYLEQTIALEKQHTRSHAHIVRFYYSKKNKSAAKQHLARSIILGKKKGDIYFQRARRAEKSRQYNKALHLYRLAIKESPAWDAAFIRIFEIYRVQKNFTAAVQVLEELVHMVPFHVKARIALGHLYFSKKISKYRNWNIKRAIIHLEKAAELEPKNPAIFHLLSDIYLFIGEDVKGTALEKKAYDLEESDIP